MPGLSLSVARSIFSKLSFCYARIQAETCFLAPAVRKEPKRAQERVGGEGEDCLIEDQLFSPSVPLLRKWKKVMNFSFFLFYTPPRSASSSSATVDLLAVAVAAAVAESPLLAIDPPLGQNQATPATTPNNPNAATASAPRSLGLACQNPRSVSACLAALACSARILTRSPRLFASLASSFSSSQAAAADARADAAARLAASSSGGGGGVPKPWGSYTLSCAWRRGGSH